MYILSTKNKVLLFHYDDCGYHHFSMRTSQILQKFEKKHDSVNTLFKTFNLRCYLLGFLKKKFEDNKPNITCRLQGHKRRIRRCFGSGSYFPSGLRPSGK